MDNDARGLLFFIFGFTAMFLVLDDLFGKNYLTNFSSLLTSKVPKMSVSKSISDTVDNAVNEKGPGSSVTKNKDGSYTVVNDDPA